MAPSVRWVSAAPAGSVAAPACVRLRDLSSVQHISGIRTAPAWNLSGGMPCLPLELDGRTAGTRYVPTVFVLLAALARVLGGCLLAAKGLALVPTAWGVGSHPFPRPLIRPAALRGLS